MLLWCALQGQDPQSDVRVCRMYQGGAEVGRETYRVAGKAHHFTSEIPILNARYRTRVELDSVAPAAPRAAPAGALTRAA